MLMPIDSDRNLSHRFVRAHARIRKGLLGCLGLVTAIWVSHPNECARGTDAPPDPVLGLLLQKGMITEDEASHVKAQMDAMRTNEAAAYPPPPESQWKISPGIKDIEIFGDIRLRFEDREARDTSGGNILLQRYRYSLRFGLRGDAFDDFYYGFRLDTSSNPRSSMVTFGTSSSGTPYQGPFGKSNGGIDVGQAYLGWKPETWLDVTAGKMPNPLFTSSMVWSGSINPEGLAERVKYRVGEADLFVNFGQFVYQDVNPVETPPGFFSSLGTYNGGSPAYLMAYQGGVDYHFTKKLDLKVGPAIYDYLGGPANTSPTTASPYTPGYGDTYVGQGAANGFSGFPLGEYDGYYANQTGINELLVLEVPFQLTLNLEHYDVQAFGDYAQNLDGSQRAQDAYAASHQVYNGVTAPISVISSPQTHDTTAYQAGLAVASKGGLGLVNAATAKRHAWEVRSYWQHVEQYSLDPNLIDLDFFSGQENLQGIYAAAAYGFTDNFIGAFRYGYATRINNQLGTGGSGTDIQQMNAISEYSIFQVDLTFKF